MTPKQREVYDLIRKRPEITFRGIAKELGVSVGAVQTRLNALIAKGLVSRTVARWETKKTP